VKLFLRGCAVLRYSGGEAEGRSSYELVCENKEYDLSSLDGKARNQTRQGLKNCVVQPIDFDLLSEQGLEINRSVFVRQARPGPPFLAEEKLWRQYMSACRAFNDVGAWGAFVGGQLCAFVLTVVVDDYAYLFHPHAQSESLRLRPMNALVFAVVQTMMRREGVRRVSYGLEPFESLPELEHFKLSMGFQKKSIGRRILVSPLARPFLSTSFETFARGLIKLGLFERYLADYFTFAQFLKGVRSAQSAVRGPSATP
jgi:hypothetical protein